MFAVKIYENIKHTKLLKKKSLFLFLNTISFPDYNP